MIETVASLLYTLFLTASANNPFANAVHVARFSERRNLDVTIIDRAEPVGLVAYGSLCLSFVIAGKRAGLDDFWRQV